MLRLMPWKMLLTWGLVPGLAIVLPVTVASSVPGLAMPAPACR